MNEPSTALALTLPASALQTLTRCLPRAQNLDAALTILEDLRQQLLGPGLLTVNLNLNLNLPPAAAAADTIELRRAWSSQPAAYPVGGHKRKQMTPWTRQLFQHAQPFVGEGDHALAQAFDDCGLILSMGLHAVVNVPLVVHAGHCFATFNVLTTRPHWRPQELLLVELLAAFALPSVRDAWTAAMPPWGAF